MNFRLAEFNDGLHAGLALGIVVLVVIALIGLDGLWAAFVKVIDEFDERIGFTKKR